MEPFRLFFAPEFIEDLANWRRINPKIAGKIDKLLEDVARDPFHGIGKPERLKHRVPNLWARRITDEHRLVYLVDQGKISFLQCRYHYTPREPMESTGSALLTAKEMANPYREIRSGNRTGRRSVF